MFEAQLLRKGAEVYSPWFPKEGDNIQIAVDIVETTTNASISVSLETKNTEVAGAGSDSGGGTLAPAAGSLNQHVKLYSTAGVSPTPTTVLQELVRYKFVAGGSTSSDWVLFRMLPPVWFDSVHVKA